MTLKYRKQQFYRIGKQIDMERSEGDTGDRCVCFAGKQRIIMFLAFHYAEINILLLFFMSAKRQNSKMAAI